MENNTSSLSEEERLYLRSLEKADPTSDIIKAYFARSLERECGVNWQPTGWSKERYLDFAEARVRQFEPCLNFAGAVIDPYDGEEHQYSTACFAMAGAVLLSAGRLADLEESVMHAMDWAIDCLRRNEVPNRHADFVTHMLVKAHRLLRERASAVGRVAGWREGLASVEPERVYNSTESMMPSLRHVRNWATYAMLGEQMRIKEGLADTGAWIDRYLEAQMPRFAQEGLYRDPNLPVAYDLAARDNLAGLLNEGYEGPYVGLLNKLLRRGARTMLFTQSTTGEVSCGGRSNQFLWNEFTFAHICEREAVIYRDTGDLRLAGIFKRAARRAAQALERWIDQPDIRLNKSMFPPENRNGYEFYAYHANYLLYAAKTAASCYLEADDRIAEAPAPCDTGDYVLHLPSFHRIYATGSPRQGSYHLCIDTFAQMGHDATGLVRLHRAGVPGETALSMGIAGLEKDVPPAYSRPNTDVSPPSLPTAIGLQWRDEHGTWHRLAGYGRSLQEVFHALNRGGQPLEGEEPNWRTGLRLLASSDNALRFEVDYLVVNANGSTDADPGESSVGTNVTNLYRRRGADVYQLGAKDIVPRPGNGSCARITERYTVSTSGVDVEWEAEAAAGGEITGIAAVAPVLLTNGRDKSELVCKKGSSVTLRYLGSLYMIEPGSGNGESAPTLELFPGRMPNRNGHYRLAQWTRNDANRITLRFILQPPEQEQGN